MNFKTTIVLIVLLAAAGAWLFFTQDHSSTPPTASTDATSPLMTIDSKDVTKLVVTPADGPEFSLQKVGADWQLTEPATAPADSFEVDALVKAFTDAKTRGQIDAGGDVTGLAKPRYQVQIFTLSKIIKLAIGDKSALGDSLYVQMEGQSKADMIPTDLSDKLDKGSDAYRKMNLVTATTDQIKQLSITRPDGTIVLQKTGTTWQIVQPQKMPADDSAVSDLLFAITGLRADKFVDPKLVPTAATAAPQITVAFSTDEPVVPPATAPSTEPTWTSIAFGSYDDMLKKNVYVKIAGSDAIAKVVATSMDAFRKRPLELRDKKAIDLDPDQVSQIVLQTNLPATTQPVAAAVNQTLTIERRKVNPVLGPVMSTTSPTTMATTAPATQPVQSKWVITTTVPATPAARGVAARAAMVKTEDADDTKITALLTALHPLRADQYLDLPSPAQPTGNYILKITTTGPGGSPVVEHQIAIKDPGHDQPLIGYSDGLTFQTARTLTSSLTGPWKTP